MSPKRYRQECTQNFYSQQHQTGNNLNAHEEYNGKINCGIFIQQYSSRNKKRTLSQALKCMNLIGIMLSWRIQTQKKYTLYDCIFFFLKKFTFFYLFIYGCVGSSFLCEGFLQLWQVGATLHRGARASHYRGLSCCGAQAPDAQAQQLWLTRPVAPRHVGSSQTGARTRVPCIVRQTLNHCATREALTAFI